METNSFCSVCGISCDGCPFFGDQCSGCNVVSGKPFWSKDLPGQVCPIYECCMNLKNLPHCGVCSELPCQTFLSLRDPALSDEEFQTTLQKRLQVLRQRI